MVHRGNTQEITVVLFNYTLHLTVKCNLPKVNAHFLCLKKRVGIFFKKYISLLYLGGWYL